jgi:hypothetical protein
MQKPNKVADIYIYTKLKIIREPAPFSQEPALLYHIAAEFKPRLAIVQKFIMACLLFSFNDTRDTENTQTTKTCTVLVV